MNLWDMKAVVELLKETELDKPILKMAAYIQEANNEAQQKSDTVDDMDYPEDSTHENGTNVRQCKNCLKLFIGHKQRQVCKVCAIQKLSDNTFNGLVLTKNYELTLPELSANDMSALATFKAHYPTWWWKLGWCDLTRDFDCAPQARSPEFEYIKGGAWPDDVFTADSRGTFADAIKQVMADIDEAIAKVQFDASKP